MRQKTMILEFLAEWEHLLGSVNDDARLANMVTQAKLADTLNRAKTTLLKQAEQQAAKQTSSQELAAVMELGKDAAREFKGELISRIGSRSEELVQFKVKPLRKGARRSRAATSKGRSGKQPQATPPIQPESPAPVSA